MLWNREDHRELPAAKIMTTPTQPPEGRVYHLRPRSPAAQRALEQDANIIQMVDWQRGKSRPLAEVESLVHVCDADTVFDYAYAAHQRVHPRQGVSFRRIVTGARAAPAKELLYTRRAGRLIPDLEDWMETLHLGSRPVVEAFLSQYRWVPAKDGHDCDCTCAGDLGHGLWDISSPAWRPVDIPVLLRALVAGDRVQVRLG